MLQMDIPEPMIDEQVRNMIDDYARRLQSQGICFGPVHAVHRHDHRDSYRSRCVRRLSKRHPYPPGSGGCCRRLRRSRLSEEVS